MLFQIMVSILLVALQAFVSDGSEINDKLTQFSIDDEVGYEADMLNFLEQSHHFLKTQREAGSIAVKKVAVLQANQANIKHAIRGAVTELAGKILDDYIIGESKGESDLNEASAVVARVLVRAKFTILEVTGSLWKRCYKLIEQHREANGMEELLEEILIRLEKDPLSMDQELEFQRETLSKFSFSDTLSENNFLEAADSVIDTTFDCNECSGLATEVERVGELTPLATDEILDEWLAKYIDENYLEKIRRSEEHIKGLMGDEQESSPEEWESVKLEDIAAKLKELAAKH